MLFVYYTIAKVATVTTGYALAYTISLLFK